MDFIVFGFWPFLKRSLLDGVRLPSAVLSHFISLALALMAVFSLAEDLIEAKLFSG